MKKITTILSIFVAFFIALASNGSVKAISTVVSGQEVAQYAGDFIGAPYVSGGNGPSGFDSSGFVQYVYKNVAGINLPRDTYRQINVGTAVSKNELYPGDLVFPNKNDVGIYIGNGQMIHASYSHRKIEKTSVYAFYAGRRVVTPSLFIRSNFMKQIKSSSLPVLKNCEIKSGTNFYNIPGGNKNGTISSTGYKVNIYAKWKEWYLVNNITSQWIHQDNIVSMPQLPILAKGKSVSKILLFRENPYEGELTNGYRDGETEVVIYGEYNGYYLVNISKNLQWVNKDDIKITSMPGLPSTSTDPIKKYVAPEGIKCYSLPTANKNNVNGVIPENRELNVYAEYKGWYLVNKVNSQWIWVKIE
ncbi:C40 family peptidase [Clostridium botulinum]|uniref:C40 family peptidase n=1 Tax=Clostridium botulinum TaxID=1491 RepID=UPI000D139F80|nr:C40 family peptidase [Clostridium botulinum]AVQ47113.1 hypothetical protein C7M60_15535 [Clostridium botulinum]AVQ50588.1 hypothetical protein C7M58_15110 [Clostridium botulinum]